MRRLAVALALAVCAALPATAQAVSSRANWDKQEQQAVQRAGVMSAFADGFHGADPLTADQLNTALAAIATRNGVKPVAAASGTRVTVAAFHRLVVKQLGLADLARSV